jgi:hypothetical protein
MHEPLKRLSWLTLTPSMLDPGCRLNRAKRDMETAAGQLPMHLSAAMLNRRCRLHGGPSPGAPKGNRNAFKHGYTTAAIATRREIADLLRTMRSLAKGT